MIALQECHKNVRNFRSSVCPFGKPQAEAAIFSSSSSGDSDWCFNILHNFNLSSHHDNYWCYGPCKQWHKYGESWRFVCRGPGRLRVSSASGNQQCQWDRDRPQSSQLSAQSQVTQWLAPWQWPLTRRSQAFKFELRKMLFNSFRVFWSGYCLESLPPSHGVEGL